MDDNGEVDDPPLGGSTSQNPPTLAVELSAEAQEDMVMESLTDSDHEDQDVDMTRHLETGFKRIESSFADENPFDALLSIDCDFQVFQPEVPSDLAQGVLIVPHLRTVSTASGPLPTKKRSLTLPRASEEDLLLEEALRLSEQETRLLVRQDQVDSNVQQLDVVESLLHGSKNMDQIVTSMCELPLAWTMAFCKDMINGGKATAELADIHLWNRILAANVTDGVARTFHERMSKMELKTGNTRGSYVKFITSVFATLPISVQKQWELLHCLSGFELLLLSSCPALFKNRNWLHPLVGETSSFLPHNGVELLSNGTLLRLLRSQVGKQLMQVLQRFNRRKLAGFVCQCTHDYACSSGHRQLVVEPVLDVGQSCKVLTWNVRGIKEGGNPLISKHLKYFYFSCIQETRFRDKSQAKRFSYLVHQSYGGHVFYSDKNGERQHTTYPRSGGVATTIHGSCPAGEEAAEVTSMTVPNRYLVIKMPWGNSTCYIHNIYAPNDPVARRDFFEQLPTTFEDNAVHIVCGDFNLALDPDLDAVSSHPRPDNSRQAVLTWLSELNVVDAWRLHHPEDRVFSGPRPRRNRIDYIFLSDSLLAECYHDASYETWDYGDHRAHQVELTSWHHPTGPGFWKLPEWLLDIPILREDIVAEAKALLPVLRESANPGIVWKVWKQKMKCYLKRCQRNLRSATYADVEIARDHVEECAKAVAQEDANDQASIDYYFAKKRLDECQDEWTAFRKRVGFERTVTEGEKSSKFFFRAPRFELRKTPLSTIRQMDGTVSTDPADITTGFQRHWGEIFADRQFSLQNEETDSVAQERLLESINRELTPDATESLEEDFTRDEFASSIRSMRTHSAPGPDGFTTAFYQLDAETFGEILREVFCYQLQRGELLPHQRYSSVALLFKKGDRADPGNYRPISLMPVEVKVLSRVITHRLRPYMNQLVHPDQKGFIPGRSIQHQVMLVRDLQHLVTTEDREGLATFLDFAKAYDRVDRSYLLRVLEHQKFGPKFLSWIRLLYVDSECSLMINGWAQTALKPSRGVKQGDPLSPFLFALSLEPLGNLLREYPNHGVRVDNNLRIATAFFADDTVLFSRNRSHLQDQLNLVDCYCKGSGALLNNSKSVIMSLNKHQEPPELQPLRSLRDGETVRYLGIPFGNADTATILANELNRKITTRIQLWKGRARTLLGRRLIAQTIVFSVIWYFTATVAIPIRFLTRWQRLLNRYVLYNKIGGGGFNLVKRDLATRPQEADGLGVPVIMNSIKRQQFQLLQQVVQAFEGHPRSSGDTVWYRPLIAMLGKRYGPFWRPGSSGFLFQDPPRPSRWKATMLPVWWRQLLREWNRLQWPDRRLLSTSRVQVLQYALYNPIWWSKCQDFQVATSVPLGAGSVKFRNLCRALAKANKHCLADFLDNDRHWLSSGEFFEMVCSIVEPELGSRILLRDIFVLYYQMRSIYQRVLPHPEAGGLRRAVSNTTPPSLGVVVTASTPEGSRSRFFPGLKARDWKKLIQPLDELEQHPMIQLGCPRGRVHQTLTQVLWLRRCLVPVVHDLMLRLFFGDLIVGSRLFFMLTSNPNAQLCVRDGCDSIETLEHCFLTCPALTQMWQILWSQWRRAFRSTLEWKLLLFPSNRDVARGWRGDQENLLLLWRMHTAIVFHATWRLRNDIYFGETQAVTPNVANLQASFRSHCHFLFRHSSDWNIDGGALNRVLTRLGFVSEQTALLPNLPRQRIWTPRC